MKSRDVIRTDVVIVGGGVAGMAAALHAGPRRVLLVSKAAFSVGGSSPLAQGGVAVALGADDSPQLHAEDTLAAGAGLCDPAVVRAITAEAPRRISDLVALGASFDRTGTGAFSLGREAAHRKRRILHAAGDATGAELVRALAAAVSSASHIEVMDHQMVVDLLVERNRVVGVTTVDRDGRPRFLSAAGVVLATGGIGQLYARTTNPNGATGDGLALAARAGARLSGLEFVQFHPTALFDQRDPAALLTEALRGEGALLLDDLGERFMVDVHELAELAPRDVVARTIAGRMAEGRKVFLDTTGLGATLRRRFPTVVDLCAQRGLDPLTDLLPISPAAHYHMGGVVTDLDGRTSMPGLWACGEVGSTGLHGGNRLASNSLIEALVVGARCGERLRQVSPLSLQTARRAGDIEDSPWIDGDRQQETVAKAVRLLMQDAVGVERNARGLREARLELQRLRNDLASERGELNNMVICGSLLARAAEARTESRGAHFRADIPCTSLCWRQDLTFEGETMMPPRAVSRAV